MPFFKGMDPNSQCGVSISMDIVDTHAIHSHRLSIEDQNNTETHNFPHFVNLPLKKI